MTLAYTPIPVQGREQLAGNDVRRGLTALLRRRVPSQEVDDVAQTVLADALAAQVIPTDPEELRRWLTGIARHKIADFHRRAARTNARINSDVEPTESVAACPAAYEEREVLENLLNEPRTRRDAETMEWLVREHAGERLQDIATENNVPAPVVRQRVSRLRRALRSRWIGVFGLVALLAAISALGLHAYEPTEAIAPEPSSIKIGPPVAPASATPLEVLKKEVDGDWVVQTVTPNRALTPNEKRLVDLQAKSASVHIDGKRIELRAREFKMTWEISSVEKMADGKARVHITNEAGMTDTADITLKRDGSGPRLEVSLQGTRFGGTVLLRRPVL